MTNVQRLAANARDASDTVWRYRLLVASVFTLFLIVAIVFVNGLPRQYVGAASVLVVNGNTRDDPTLSSPDLPSIVTSTVLLERVKQVLNLDTPVISLKRHLVVKQPAYKSSIMRIEYTDQDPTRVAVVANGVAEQLALYYREMSTARFDSELRALDSELNKQSDRLRRIDRRLGQAGELAATAVDGTGTDSLATRLTSLETDRALSSATLEGDVSHMQAVGLDADTRYRLLRHDVLQSDDTYRGLLGSALASSVQLENVRGVYTKAYPGLPALETKVRSLNAAVDSEARRALNSPNAYSPSVEAAVAEQRKAAAVVQADQAKVAALDSLIAKEHLRLDAMQPLQLLRLQRTAAQSDYLSISGRRAAALANRADALSLGSVIVTDRAFASEAQAQVSHKALVLLAVVLALLAALGSAFLADQLNPQLRRAAKIEELYGHPVIATLGKM